MTELRRRPPPSLNAERCFGAPEKYFTLGKRGEEFLGVMQLNLESDIKALQR